MRNCMQGFVLQPLIKYPTFFFLLLLVGSFVSIYLLNIPILNRSNLGQIMITKTTSGKCPRETKTNKNPKEVLLNCTGYTNTRTCHSNNKPVYISDQDPNCSSEPSTCPEYFQWIYEDLRPWFRTGITSEMVEKARAKSHFKLVIVNGKAYVEKYGKAFQTRDLFTWWGFAQLLRRYPGKMPDLELVFSCHDWPVFLARDYPKANATDPGILFGYCGDEDTVDIAFPDWSYWGWPEVNIKPWEYMVKDIGQGNRNMKWVEREPFAFWKGNPGYAQARKDLMKCNRTAKEDWNARLYTQDWGKESKEGFKNSDLASQCTHRYKIYVEGNAWSVSQKYILACDYLTLLINSSYYDFFSRGLKPLQHYWPIKANDKCRSIKHAVDWGNTNQKEAQAIGKAATKFINEELKMDHVYDYMFHLLNVYAKLLKFKPTIPQKAFKLCLESMFCQANELEKRYMMDSMEKGPADTNPCTIPSPFGPSFYKILDKAADSFKKVDLMKKTYWENQNKST